MIKTLETKIISNMQSDGLSNNRKENISLKQNGPNTISNKVHKDLNAMKIVYPKQKFIYVKKDILKGAQISNTLKILNKVNIQDLIPNSAPSIDLDKIQKYKVIFPSKKNHNSNTDCNEEVSIDHCGDITTDDNIFRKIDMTSPIIVIPPLENINILNKKQINEIKYNLSKNINESNSSNEYMAEKIIPEVKANMYTTTLTQTSDMTYFPSVSQQNNIKSINNRNNCTQRDELLQSIGFRNKNLVPLIDFAVQDKVASIDTSTTNKNKEISIHVKYDSSISSSNKQAQHQKMQCTKNLQQQNKYLSELKHKNIKNTKMNNLMNPLNDECEDFNRKLKKNLIPKIGHAATASILLRFNQVRNLHTRKNLLEELDEYVTKFDILQDMKKKTIKNTYNDSSNIAVKAVSPRADVTINQHVKKITTVTKETQTELNENDNCNSCKCKYQSHEQENLNENNDFGFDMLLKYINSPTGYTMHSSSTGVSNKCLDVIEEKSLDSIFHKENNLSNIKNSNTPLQKKNESVESLHKEIFKLYVFKEWTNCNTPDQDGYFPIHRMILQDNELLVRRQCLFLKSKNLDINIKTNTLEMMTPLHIAIENGCTPAVILTLLENKVDPESQDFEGNTCLHYAIKFNNLKAMKMMIDSFNTLDLNIYNYDGFTPFLYSVILNRIEIVKLLIKHGANINAKDQKSGRTALFHAIENNFVQMFKLLLDSGADIKIKMMSGLTVWDAIHELSNVNTVITDSLVAHENSPNYLKYSWERKKKNSHNFDINEPPVKKRKYVKKNEKKI